MRAQYAKYFGEEHALVERNAGVEVIVFAPGKGLDLCTAATVGLSESGVAAVVPQELVCSVKEGQEGAAVALVEMSLGLILGQRRGFIDEDIVANDGPLLSGTGITGVLTGAHPYLPDEFNVVFGPDGEAIVNLVSLVPLLRTEVEFGQRESIDDLIDLLQRENPDLSDILRAATT